jgi:hypothetical protein
MLRFQSRYLFICNPDFQNLVKRAGINHLFYISRREWRGRQGRGGRTRRRRQAENGNSRAYIIIIYVLLVQVPARYLGRLMLNNRGMRRGPRKDIICVSIVAMSSQQDPCCYINILCRLQLFS